MEGNRDWHILVVDDEVDPLSLLVEGLTESGYTVAGATDGESALQMFLHDIAIAVVVTDLRLPDMSGQELLVRMKQLRPHTQVIMMTGFGGVTEAVEAMKAGAFTFLIKPLVMFNLGSLVEQSLRLAAAESLLARLVGTVFLSYAREDARAVQSLYGQLRAAGFRPWMDTEDLIAGERWEEAVGRAIKSASVFIACLSPRSVSKRGTVQKEIRTALDICSEMPEGHIYLLPLRLEPCDVPLALREYQWVDLFDTKGWDRLTQAIRRALELRADDVKR